MLLSLLGVVFSSLSSFRFQPDLKVAEDDIHKWYYFGVNEVCSYGNYLGWSRFLDNLYIDTWKSDNVGQVIPTTYTLDLVNNAVLTGLEPFYLVRFSNLSLTAGNYARVTSLEFSSFRDTSLYYSYYQVKYNYTILSDSTTHSFGQRFYIFDNFRELDNDEESYEVTGYLFNYSFIETDLNYTSPFDLGFRIIRYDSEYYTPFQSSLYDVFTSNNDSDDLGFQAGYSTGYDAGYVDGNIYGYDNGYNAGYSNGFNAGYDDALVQDQTALTIFTGITEVGLLPINVFLSIFNYEIFGINMSALVSALLTVAIVIILVRLLTGKKE